MWSRNELSLLAEVSLYWCHGPHACLTGCRAGTDAEQEHTHTHTHTCTHAHKTAKLSIFLSVSSCKKQLSYLQLSTTRSVPLTHCVISGQMNTVNVTACLPEYNSFSQFIIWKIEACLTIVREGNSVLCSYCLDNWRLQKGHLVW